MSLTQIAEADIKAAIEAHFAPIKSALENVGYTVKFSSWAARFDYRAGGEATITSHLREFWNCRIRLHCNWKSGAIEKVTLQLRPARTVTLKYTDKTLPVILERVADCFQADIDAEAKRNQDRQQATAWAIQALRDTQGLNLPECLVPSWCRDSDDANQRFSYLHRGMARTPIGRYFPNIDGQALSGPEGLTAAQLRYLVECLNNLPNIT